MSKPKGRKKFAAKLLRGAAKDIETFGWTKYEMGHELIGFCALGGIRHARKAVYGDADVITNALRPKFNADHDLAREALAVVVTGQPCGSIPQWNDYMAASKEEVTRAMRQAAAKLEHGLKV